MGFKKKDLTPLRASLNYFVIKMRRIEKYRIKFRLIYLLYMNIQRYNV